MSKPPKGTKSFAVVQLDCISNETPYIQKLLEKYLPTCTFVKFSVCVHVTVIEVGILIFKNRNDIFRKHCKFISVGHFIF